MDNHLFQIISDIHITNNSKWQDYLVVSAPYLIVCGDVGNVDNIELYEKFMCELSKQYKNVFLIAGNHEYYSENKTFEFLNSELRNLTTKIENLIFLDDEYYDLPGNIRIYGSTLWSSIKNLTNILPINSIFGKAGYKTWLNKMHYNSLYYLERVIDDSKKLGKRLIIATHYPPTDINTVTEKHKKSSRLEYYVNNLEYLLTKELVYIWIYGHTHINSDYLTCMDTRVVSNQYNSDGYKNNKILKVKYKI